jgi:signal transduction histidine kinase
MFFYFYKLILKADNLELSMGSIEKNALEIPSLIFHEIKGNLNALSINSKLLNHKLNNLQQADIPDGLKIMGAGESLIPPIDWRNTQSGIEKISRIIESETSRLNLTMENIIRFTKNFDLYLEDVDVKDLIKESTLEISSKASSKNIELKINTGENIIVRMDRALMKHALINLISNAIDSYDNHSGIVYIYSSFYLSKAIIIVEDKGKGMSKKEMKRVYDPFFTTKKSGIGLGLSFVKKITNAHNFSINIESNHSDGTKVSIYLGNVFN